MLNSRTLSKAISHVNRGSLMPPGALLLHGFTATPECMESLAAPLEEAGFLVKAPLLPGHGTHWKDLLQIRWEDWYEAVSESFQELQREADPVCVAGLSLGGLLGLMLASQFPVHRLALLATPVFFKGFLSRMILPIIARTPLKDIYRYQRKWLGAAITDPWGKRHFKSYDEMPIASIWEIVRLQKTIRQRLPKITVPTLILHSPHDITAPYENMAFLEKQLGSKIIQTVSLERSNHVLTMDYEKNLVAKEVVDFFGGQS